MQHVTLHRASALACAALCFFCFGADAQAQSTALFEDFEDADVTYSAQPSEFSDGSYDFFLRTDGSGIGGQYEVEGANGSFYFGAQDLDGQGADLPTTLTFSGIDISGLTDLQFSALFAEDDDGESEDYDSTDYVHVSVSIDGGDYVQIFGIENNGDRFNSAPFVDEDLDGTGEGAEITSTFEAFSAEIDGTGSTLDLRISFSLNSEDEDIAIDDVRITGQAAAVAEACTTESPLYISAFATGDPGSVTVTNSSAAETVDLPGCTLAAYDGYSELVVDSETAPTPLAPQASYVYTPTVPAGQPGAIVVSSAELAAGDGVADAAGSVVAAVVYDSEGDVYGECGNGPDVDPCDSEEGQASILNAFSELFGGSTAGEDDGAVALGISVAPNPVQSTARVTFGVAEPADVRVAVYDALGREVAVLAAGPYASGEHEASLEGAALPAGVYVLRATVGADAWATPITIVR